MSDMRETDNFLDQNGDKLSPYANGLTFRQEHVAIGLVAAMELLEVDENAPAISSEDAARELGIDWPV